MVKEECVDTARLLLDDFRDFDKLWRRIVDLDRDDRDIGDLQATVISIDSFIEEIEPKLFGKHHKELTTKLKEIGAVLKEEGKDDGVQKARVKLAQLFNDYGTIFTDIISDCECGEPEEIQLKVPIMISKTVEDALKQAGYDVGTDAYYADPDSYVSVIVRATKDLELRRGG